MQLTRRKTIALGTLVVVATVAVLVFTPFGLSIADAERINKGMSREEVALALGRDKSSFPHPLLEIWDVSDGFIIVRYESHDNRVSRVQCESLPRWKKWMIKVQYKLGI
jgi:hypothetical protein